MVLEKDSSGVLTAFQILYTPCAGSQGIPTDESQIATDLYDGLQAFFAQNDDLQKRPLFITGESYAGKYVPALGELVT